MRVLSREWLWLLTLLLGLVVAPGCQSCQDTDSPPPAGQKAPPAEAEQAAPPADAADEPEAAADEEDVVDEDALVLLAEGEPEDGPAPLSVSFTVESLIEDEMNEPQYKWDFGDGSPVSTEAKPTHVYEKPGSYTVTIRIVDAAGQLGWDEVDIDVEEPE